MTPEEIEDVPAEDRTQELFILHKQNSTDHQAELELKKIELLSRILEKEKSIRDLQKQRICRICLGEGMCESNEDDEEKILITPCNCTGSSKFIHVKCLRDWIKTKRVVKENTNTVNYIFKLNKCELCQAIFPNQVVVNNEPIEIFEVDRPEHCHYLILEVLGLPNGKNI